MAIFKDTTITDNGRALIANALGNNKQITFTRMVTSSKVYSDTTDISKLINIDEIKQTVNLSRVSQEGTKVRLNAIFTNASVNSAYKIETIGLYGKIDSGNEILYSVTRAAEADTMPATNGINLATVEIDLITEINNSNGATMAINPSTLVTLSTLQDYIKHEEKINWMGTDGYGGLLQDAGTKKVGIAYYDKANKQMVVPTIENTLTYFEGSKFIPISDYQTAKKLENLFRITEYKNLSLSNVNNGTANGYTIGNIAFFHFHDVSPVSSNGRNIICKLPVPPLLAFEGTAVIIQNNLRAERFSVNKSGEVQIVGDGTIQANLKYSFSFSFPFSV